MKKQTIFVIAIIGIALLIGIWRDPGHPLTLAVGTQLNEPKLLPSFSLVDMDGKSFTQEAFKNKWTFLFFGYTHCPELCPTTLDAMKTISQRMGRGLYPQFVLISINPAQDTPERLKTFFQQDRYQYFPIKGVTGDIDTIKSLAHSIGLHIAKATPKVEHIEHSGALVLVNPKGQLAAVFSSTEKPGAIAHDFKQIVSSAHKLD